VDALILMTRIPLPGETKTRLQDILTANECAAIHRAFLKDLMNTFTQLKKVDIFVTYTPHNDKHLHILKDIFHSNIKLFPQSEGSLGMKMHNALNNVFLKGYKNIILMGSDVPSITSKDIMASFQLLNDSDVVLGPTFDGGYYLIGLKSPRYEIFDLDEKWGGTSVLETTIRIVESLGLTIGLSAKQRDIDTKEDLFQYEKEHINCLDSHTIQFIHDWRKLSYLQTN